MPNNHGSERDAEQRPLLGSQQRSQHNHDYEEDYNNNRHNTNHEDEGQKVDFEEHDDDNPREWPLSRKYIQALQIYIISFICPMASSALATAMDDISTEFNTPSQITMLAQAGFVCMLGIGPLLHAPMSETFGRRPIFLINLTLFTILQIPTALSPNITTLIFLRTLSGFFGSVGVANGGGSVTDMFETHKRAKVLGFYLTGPLLGPTIGPLLGGVIIGQTNDRQWRHIFWTILILATLTTITSYFFLRETQAKTILQHRQHLLEVQYPDRKYYIEGVTQTQRQKQSLLGKIATNSTRAVRILTTQPIVMTMTIYQSLIFSSMYSLYAEYTKIFSSKPYNFSPTQIGLAYLGPASGFIITAIFTILYVDKVYNYLASKNSNKKDNDNDNDNNSDSQQQQQQQQLLLPEYRLPLANIGAVFLPISLFWFGWAIQNREKWYIPIMATMLFGAAQVSIFNCVQTYYIDAYEKNAASALAAGAFLRSIVGGVVPIFVSSGLVFDRLGYGWGMGLFGFLSLLLMPAPLLFYRYGRLLREKFPFKD